MKTFAKMYFAIVLSFAVLWGSAAAQPFIHPGILHNRAELDFIKDKIKAGAEPWKTRWEKMRAATASELTMKPRPFEKVNRGAYGNPSIGSNEMIGDCAAAYSQAIQWTMTDDPAHADKAIEILNAYASTLKTIGGHDTRLLVGMTGIFFVNAAEIIRHTSNRWKAEDQKLFEGWLRNTLYPLIKNFYPTANGNWDAAMNQTMMSMGIFLDDRDMFNRGMNHALGKETNGSIPMYFNDFGECQENGRDQGHTQMGMNFLSKCCEIAWKQGIDMYGTLDNRLAKGFEYTSKFMLGNDVPFEYYHSYKKSNDHPTISQEGRGRFSPIYEITYHHYHDRMGMEMPYTKGAVDAVRARAAGGGMNFPQGDRPRVRVNNASSSQSQNANQPNGPRDGRQGGRRGGRGFRGSWDTLMFGDLPSFPKGYDAMAKKP